MDTTKCNTCKYYRPLNSRHRAEGGKVDYVCHYVIMCGQLRKKYSDGSCASYTKDK